MFEKNLWQDSTMFVVSKQGNSKPFCFDIFANAVKRHSKYSIVYDGVREGRPYFNPYFMAELCLIPTKADGPAPVYPRLEWNVVLGL